MYPERWCESSVVNPFAPRNNVKMLKIKAVVYLIITALHAVYGMSQDANISGGCDPPDLEKFSVPVLKSAGELGTKEALDQLMNNSVSAENYIESLAEETSKVVDRIIKNDCFSAAGGYEELWRNETDKSLCLYFIRQAALYIAHTGQKKNNQRIKSQVKALTTVYIIWQAYYLGKSTRDLKIDPFWKSFAEICWWRTYNASECLDCEEKCKKYPNITKGLCKKSERHYFHTCDINFIGMDLKSSDVGPQAAHERMLQRRIHYNQMEWLLAGMKLFWLTRAQFLETLEKTCHVLATQTRRDMNSLIITIRSTRFIAYVLSAVGITGNVLLMISLFNSYGSMLLSLQLLIGNLTLANMVFLVSGAVQMSWKWNSTIIPEICNITCDTSKYSSYLYSWETLPHRTLTGYLASTLTHGSTWDLQVVEMALFMSQQCSLVTFVCISVIILQAFGANCEMKTSTIIAVTEIIAAWATAAIVSVFSLDIQRIVTHELNQSIANPKLECDYYEGKNISPRDYWSRLPKENKVLAELTSHAAITFWLPAGFACIFIIIATCIFTAITHKIIKSIARRRNVSGSTAEYKQLFITLLTTVGLFYISMTLQICIEVFSNVKISEWLVTTRIEATPETELELFRINTVAVAARTLAFIDPVFSPYIFLIGSKSLRSAFISLLCSVKHIGNQWLEMAQLEPDTF